MWFEEKLRSDVSGALIGIRLMFSWQWSEWLPGWAVPDPRVCDDEGTGPGNSPSHLFFFFPSYPL